MVKAIVIDIEGTTSSVDFVYQTLFPYAKKHLRFHRGPGCTVLNYGRAKVCTLIITGQLRLIKWAITRDSSRVRCCPCPRSRLGDQGHMVTNRIANGERLDHPLPQLLTTPQISASASTSTRDRPQPVWSLGVAASLLTVWSRALSPGSREHGGRKIPQKGGNRCKLSMISCGTVCPSDSWFRSITKDLGRRREMPSFALSRRQRGFESRWGYHF
jgi:hypothetical protein